MSTRVLVAIALLAGLVIGPRRVCPGRRPGAGPEPRRGNAGAAVAEPVSVALAVAFAHAVALAVAQPKSLRRPRSRRPPPTVAPTAVSDANPPEPPPTPREPTKTPTPTPTPKPQPRRRTQRLRPRRHRRAPASRDRPRAPWPPVWRRRRAGSSSSLDYDGTLSEIDPDPMGARIDPGRCVALRRLARIAARPGPSAWPWRSSRAGPVPDVVRAGPGRRGSLPRQPRPRGELAATPWQRSHAGWHAAEARAAGSDSAAAAARLGRSVAAALGDPDWLFVELKGGSVAFHYRRAPDPAEAGRAIGAAVDERLAADGLELERFDGRLIVELRPDRRRRQGCGRRAAAGRAGSRRRSWPWATTAATSRASPWPPERRAAGRLAALNVGIHDRSATPPELVAAADVMLAAPRDAGRLLNALATELER